MFTFTSIAQYHTELLNKTVTCTAVVEFYLDQITALRRLNAFVRIYGEEALERARELDRKRQANPSSIGKLHGVVVAIKDVIAYKKHSLSAASRILDNFTSIYNATVVEKLLAEDAIIIGHTNCDEFAMGSTNENSVYGKVHNAIDETKVSGGSSGGSAVAVQSGCCMISLGSDTGGSVRQPADFCGIVGLKPTYGRVSRYGLIAYASSFDQIGIFATNIPDLELTLTVISGPDQYDSTVSNRPLARLAPEDEPRPLRVAYFAEALNSEALDKEITANLRAFIQKLEGDGHIVEPVHFEYLDYIVPAYYILTTAEASSNLARFDGVKYGYRHVDKKMDLTNFYCQTRSDGFGWEVKRRIMLGTLY